MDFLQKRSPNYNSRSAKNRGGNPQRIHSDRVPLLMSLKSRTRTPGAKAISTGGGRRCCSFRAVAEIGKPNTHGVAALCPGLCAHCPFRTLTIPPPCRDVACYVSNIPADDPNGDIARISNIPKRRRCTQRLYGQRDVSKKSVCSPMSYPA